MKFVKVQLFVVLVILVIETLFSTISSAQWTYHGLGGTTIQVLRTHNGFLYAGTSAGLFKKRIGSLDTTWVSLGLNSKYTTAFVILNDSTFIASISITGTGVDTISLLKSTDAGVNWLPYQNGFGGGAGSNQVRAFAMVQSQSEIMYAIGKAVAKSTDGGMSWRKVFGDHWNVARFTFITINAVWPNIIWTGGENFLFLPFILKSTTYGESWQHLPLNIGENSCLSFALHPADTNIAYLGVANGIFKTLDGGRNWSVIFAPRESRAFWGLALSRDSLLYTAGWQPLIDKPQRLLFYKSSNGGVSWDTVTHNVVGAMGVKDLLVLPDRDVDNLFVGTFGSGVFSYANVMTAVNDFTSHTVPERFSLQQNYPNPFNSETVIRFDVARSSHVKIDIIDMLGRKIETIVDANFTCGLHSTRFGMRSLSTGVYFYRMQADIFTETKKFVVVR